MTAKVRKEAERLMWLEFDARAMVGACDYAGTNRSRAYQKWLKAFKTLDDFYKANGLVRPVPHVFPTLEEK